MSDKLHTSAALSKQLSAAREELATALAEYRKAEKQLGGSLNKLAACHQEVAAMEQKLDAQSDDSVLRFVAKQNQVRLLTEQIERLETETLLHHARVIRTALQPIPDLIRTVCGPSREKLVAEITATIAR